MTETRSNKLHDKWDNVSYDEIKSSKKLQREYLKDFKIPYFEENEKIYNPAVKYNQNVFLPKEDDINSFRGNLLQAIWNEEITKNFSKQFYGVSGIARSIIIARMTGYSFQEISKATSMKTSEVKKEFVAGIQQIININRDKCRDCEFNIKFEKCKIWNVGVKKDFYCWLFKQRKG